MTKRFKVTSSTVGVLLALGSSFTPAFAATTTKTPTNVAQITIGDYHASVRSILSGNTTYMPVWYVMQGLSAMGYGVTWDGVARELNIQAPNGVNVSASNVTPGKGPMSILVNGTLIQRANSFVAKETPTSEATTYIPIWYVQQVLKHVNLDSAWMDSNLSVTPGTDYPVVLTSNKTYGNTNQTSTVQGNLLVLGTNVHVENSTVSGNVYVNPGATGEVWLENVTVSGAIIVESGATASIHIKNVTAPLLNIVSTTPVHIVSEGTTNIQKTQVDAGDEQPVSFDQNSGTLGEFDDLTTQPVTLGGTQPYTNVNVNAAGSVNLVGQSQITSLVVSGMNASVTINDGANVDDITVSDGKDVQIQNHGKVGKLTNKGDAGSVTLSGSGTVTTTDGNSIIGSIVVTHSGGGVVPVYPADASHSTVHLSSGAITAGDKLTISGVAEDAAGRPVANRVVSVAFDGLTATGTTSASGTYSVDLTPTVATYPTPVMTESLGAGAHYQSMVASGTGPLPTFFQPIFPTSGTFIPIFPISIISSTPAVTSEPVTVTVGGVSIPTEDAVSVSPAALSAEKSVISTGGGNFYIGSATTVTVHPEDQYGNAVYLTSGQTMTVSDGISSGTTVATWNTGNKDYEAAFTESGSGTVTFTASVSGTVLVSSTVTLVDPIVSSGTSQLMIPSGAVTAGDVFHVTGVAKNAGGIPLGGETVTVSFDGLSPSATIHPDGSFDVTVAPTTAGTTLALDAMVYGVSTSGSIGGQTLTVSPSTLSASKSAVTVSASGSTYYVHVTPEDQFGNTLGSGHVVTVSDGITSGTVPATWNVTDFEAQFNETTSGSITFTATIDGTALSGKTYP